MTPADLGIAAARQEAAERRERLWNAPSPDPNYETNQAARHEFFKKIAPKDNWKNPIDCWIEESDLADCEQAAIFFTGSSLEVVQRRGSKCRVQAAGYYLTIGA